MCRLLGCFIVDFLMLCIQILLAVGVTYWMSQPLIFVFFVMLCQVNFLLGVEYLEYLISFVLSISLSRPLQVSFQLFWFLYLINIGMEPLKISFCIILFSIKLCVIENSNVACSGSG